MYDDRLEVVSPGGMIDGKRIQDLNIDEVASVRRNPVVCDIFHRLKFMERRGSGLRKIRDEYASESAPSFRSTEQVFIVTLRNMNFNVDSETPNRSSTDGTTGADCGTNGADHGAEERLLKVLELIKADEKISTAKIVEATGIPKRTTMRYISELKRRGVIIRRGTQKNGQWEILE